MIYDMFEDLFTNYPSIQKILFILIVITAIGVFLLKAGFKDISIMILLICIVIIYLYAVEVISLFVFVLALMVLSVILFMVINGGKSNENS